VVDLIKENSPIPECDLQIQVNRTSQGWFAKGQSGNPAGKPRGCRNHAARIAEALLDGGVEPLTQKVMEFALDGDPTAMRLCFERIVAPRRARPVHLDLPPISEPADITAARCQRVSPVTASSNRSRTPPGAYVKARAED
jgi:Family of unknown function (DUF5681)